MVYDAAATRRVVRDSLGVFVSRQRTVSLVCPDRNGEVAMADSRPHASSHRRVDAKLIRHPCFDRTTPVLLNYTSHRCRT